MAYLPTPLAPMPKLSEKLGVDLWIKRDDCTGLALGGNKARKLEYLMADALVKKADVVITSGSRHSNHAAQTAAACKRLGLGSVVVLQEEGPRVTDGNVLLDRLLDADIRFTRNVPREISRVTKAYERRGGKVYVIPGGGSNPVGALGYVRAFKEIIDQSKEAGFRPDYVVFASSPGGTHAGLLAGKSFWDAKTSIIGLCPGDGDDPPAESKVMQMVRGTSKFLGRRLSVTAKDFVFFTEYGGLGYGKLDSRTVHVIRLVAREEGILLDPVYTGKAMVGLIDLAHRRRFFRKGSNVVFIHTGGVASLFPYRAALLAEAK